MAGRPRKNPETPETESPTTEYRVKVEYKTTRMPYATDDYWFQEATLYLGDEKIDTKQFQTFGDGIAYADINGREYTIQEWAYDKMMLDKIKRGEVESYEFTIGENGAEDAD